MTAGCIRHRLSMTVFYEADQLWSTVVDLLASGLGIDQHCCVGHYEALNDIGPPKHLSWDLSARLFGLVRCIEKYGAASSSKAIYATSGDVLHTLSQICPARSGAEPTNGASGAYNGTCRGLRHHVNAGAVLLVVAANTPRQQAASSQALLRNSRHGVQTFECTHSVDELA